LLCQAYIAFFKKRRTREARNQSLCEGRRDGHLFSACPGQYRTVKKQRNSRKNGKNPMNKQLKIHLAQNLIACQA